jgi:hypothetical protein
MRAKATATADAADAADLDSQQPGVAEPIATGAQFRWHACALSGQFHKYEDVLNLAQNALGL